MSICFGEFGLDPEARLLRRRGKGVHLGPKAFDLLALLRTAFGVGYAFAGAPRQ